MKEIKRFIDIHVPISNCNLKCHYCYVEQYDSFGKEKSIFRYSPEIVRTALSQERLGGICHFNVCGIGETLIPKELIHYIRVILENGHTVMIVTNGTLKSRFIEYMAFPPELKRHLGFKFSFHYLELKRLNLLESFFDNAKLVRANGCSFSIELVGSDEYEPYIEEIKKICMENVGAVCHITVPRDVSTQSINLLSKHERKTYYEIWKTFDSGMFNFKFRHWGEKRKEYCYAGLWSGLLNIGTGEFRPCYSQGWATDIFQNAAKPIDFCPVGKCNVAHCYNAHSFLTFGDILQIREETYSDIRDRVDDKGKHWINENMLDQFRERLENYNNKLSKSDIIRYRIKKLYLVVRYKWNSAITKFSITRKG